MYIYVVPKIATKKRVKKMEFNKLKGRMRELGLSQEKVAKEIGITPQSFNAKLNGRSQFTLDEARKIITALSLSDPNVYFFNH